MPSIALPVSLRGQLLSGSRFSPLSLFTASEPGLWYDPSDLTTLFQDTVGVVPVTAPGQPVALILDKSKRLTRGSELVVNGDFSGGTTNWTAISGAGLSIVSGSLRISYSAGAAYPAATQTVSGLVSGRTYELTIVANTGSGTHPVGLNCGQFSPTVNFTTNTSLTTTTFKAIASATSTSSYVQIFLVTNSATSSGFIDIVSFSMKELAGSHATQATAASRPTYQVDGNGFAHLSFDGVDDFLVTSTITPGTDKVQVFAGVRKLSDATRGSVIESGLGTGPDTGYFHIEAPRTGGVGHYAFRSFGATLGTFSDAFAATFNAPITNVVTGIGDIPADTSNIRVNGAAGTPGVADQGTGNYLANAIYIGRRAGTSLPFSGNMYNIVLRFGPNLDSGTIASVETFINGKTGAY